MHISSLKNELILDIVNGLFFSANCQAHSYIDKHKIKKYMLCITITNFNAHFIFGTSKNLHLLFQVVPSFHYVL